MRTLLKVLLLLLLATSSLGAATPRQARTYRKRVINKHAIAGSVAGAGVGQLRNSPHEWGQGVGGFAKRVGSSFGTHVVNATIQMGVAAVHHENLRYQRSNRHGFWPRTKYAVKST